jgi:hypothetical protein
VKIPSKYDIKSKKKPFFLDSGVEKEEKKPLTNGFLILYIANIIYKFMSEI